MDSAGRSRNPISRIAFPLVLFFVAAVFSGVLDKIPFLHYFRILVVTGGLALIAIGVSGRLPAVLKTPMAKALIVFTVWFVICIPFARWPGGSVHLLISSWYKSALSFVLTAGAVLTIAQAKTIFKTIGYSVGVLAILALGLRFHDETGRLGLFGTRYENPNDFAWTLILGLSFLSFLLLRGNHRERVTALILSTPILLALVKTGSRAGMIGLVMLVIFGFFQASRGMRIKLAMAVPFLVVLLVAIVPADFRARYTTFFTSQKGISRLEATAIGSSEIRWEVLRDSLYLTLMHPVLGVGPGDFPVAQNDLALARGESRGAWRVTHNTYTQISSEMGVPGLIIYLVFLYQCFKPLNAIVRSRYPGKDWRDLRVLAQSLRASLVTVITIAAFASYAYDINVPVLAGLACALDFIAQRQRALSKQRAQRIPAPTLTPEPALEPAWMSFQ